MLKPPQFQHLDRGRDPSKALNTQRLDFHELFGSTVRFFRNQNCTCIRQLLHSICEMHIRACGVIGLVNSVFYGLYYDFTGVNAYPDSQVGIADAFDSLLHCQRRKAAPNGVILMRLRRAKQGHDPVALRLVDHPLVTNNGFIHQIENGLQTAHSQFRITQTVDKPGRVADVGKENGETLPLATFGVQRFQHMMPGLIGCLCSRLLQRGTASAAKASGRSVEVATGTALKPESGPAAFAILIRRLILATATQTLHRWPQKAWLHLGVVISRCRDEFYIALQPG